MIHEKIRVLLTNWGGACNRKRCTKESVIDATNGDIPTWIPPILPAPISPFLSTTNEWEDTTSTSLEK